MTLAMLNMRLASESTKKSGGTTDGRCYNVRSQKKTYWEIANIKRMQKQARKRRSCCGLVRGVYSKDEIKEYAEISKNERLAMIEKRLEKERAADKVSVENQQKAGG